MGFYRLCCAFKGSKAINYGVAGTMSGCLSIQWRRRYLHLIRSHLNSNLKGIRQCSSSVNDESDPDRIAQCLDGQYYAQRGDNDGRSLGQSPRSRQCPNSRL